MDPLFQDTEDTDEDLLLTPTLTPQNIMSTQTPAPAASPLTQHPADMASLTAALKEMYLDNEAIENDGTPSASTAIHQGMQSPFTFPITLPFIIIIIRESC